MSIYVDRDIEAAMVDGDIVITPFKREHLGTNSYDVTLHPMLRVYDGRSEWMLDSRKKNPTVDLPIPEEGYVLKPGVLYLASTVEYTETKRHVPMLNGKSSLGRLGLSIHVTAGFGDVGFKGHWTMEMFVIHPLRIYPYMKIAQLVYYAASGSPAVPYDQKADAKYINRDPLPQASLSFKNFKED